MTTRSMCTLLTLAGQPWLVRGSPVSVERRMGSAQNRGLPGTQGKSELGAHNLERPRGRAAAADSEEGRRNGHVLSHWRPFAWDEREHVLTGHTHTEEVQRAAWCDMV